MAEFSKIGKGFIHQSKKGNKSIHLILDPQAQEQLANHDFERGVFIFKDKFADKNGNPQYTVMVSMPDDYQYQSGKGFNEQQQEAKETLL